MGLDVGELEFEVGHLVHSAGLVEVIEERGLVKSVLEEAMESLVVRVGEQERFPVVCHVIGGGHIFN